MMLILEGTRTVEFIFDGDEMISDRSVDQHNVNISQSSDDLFALDCRSSNDVLQFAPAQ